MAERWENLQVEDSNMKAFLCTPDGKGPFPSVLVIMGAPGVDASIQDTTRRLAAAGYASIAPDLYHRDKNPDPKESFTNRVGRLTDIEIIRDVDAAIEFLRTRQLSSNYIGITGFCLGGRVSFLMPGVHPDLFKAAVPFYAASLWTTYGKGPTTFDLLSNIKCPVLGFFGEEDHNPTTEDMRKIDSELTKNDVPHEFHCFSGAGHGFMAFPNPKMYREHAAQAAWPLLLNFLESHLKKPGAPV